MKEKRRFFMSEFSTEFSTAESKKMVCGVMNNGGMRYYPQEIISVIRHYKCVYFEEQCLK